MMDRGNSTQGGALLVIYKWRDKWHILGTCKYKGLDNVEGSQHKKESLLIILQERQYPYSTDQYGWSIDCNDEQTICDMCECTNDCAIYHCVNCNTATLWC